MSTAYTFHKGIPIPVEMVNGNGIHDPEVWERLLNETPTNPITVTWTK